MTIADYFGTSLEKFDRNAFDHLANGHLQFAYLSHSPEAGQILKCARNVVARLGPLPFAGAITLAKIMADAMAELEATKEMQAPKCWYPIIKYLRAQHIRNAGRVRMLHAPSWRPEKF
jgi:hypothetical protein